MEGNRCWSGDKSSSRFRKEVTIDLKSGKTGKKAGEWFRVVLVVHRWAEGGCGKASVLC
jgi:hypothetical protein